MAWALQHVHATHQHAYSRRRYRHLSSPLSTLSWPAPLLCLLLLLLSIASSAFSPALHVSASDTGGSSSSNTTSAADCGPSDAKAPPSSLQFWISIIVGVVCVLVGAVMSGLQVGYFSIDPLKLEILKTDPSADPKDQQRAERIAPLLKQHHLLLVTLLVANAAAMETLPIFLDMIVPNYVAIILSVTLVLFAGEIIPQALCTSNPLWYGNAAIPFIKVLKFLFLPVSWPIAKLLDRLLGTEGANHFLFKRSELHALIDLHAKTKGGTLHEDQINILKGALNVVELRVEAVMAPMDKVYTIDVSRRLDFETLSEIFQAGFSRIPVTDKSLGPDDNIVGLLIVKDLILLDPNDATPISTILAFYPRSLEKVFPDTTLSECLDIFKQGNSHLAIVHTVKERDDGDPYRVNVGLVTLEDVIEAILKTEIQDESDMSVAGMNADVSGSPLSPGGSARRFSKTSARYHLANRYIRRPLSRNQLTPQESARTGPAPSNTCKGWPERSARSICHSLPRLTRSRRESLITETAESEI